VAAVLNEISVVPGVSVKAAHPKSVGTALDKERTLVAILGAKAYNVVAVKAVVCGVKKQNGTVFAVPVEAVPGALAVVTG